MGFSTRPEIQTLASLERALGDFGYLISQKTRVLDVIRAAAELPSAPTRGPSMMDVIVPSLVEAAGPVGPQHPWLRPGDWDYAFKSHFDFVVHAPLTDRHATHPLFAVEFDGPSHQDSSTHERDLRKNRLCLAAGLPLLRVDETFLHRRDHLNLIDWCACLWAAHRRDMPGLLAHRDAEIADLDPALLDEAGSWLLGDRPDLDVDLIFRLEHPYRPPSGSRNGSPAATGSHGVMPMQTRRSRGGRPRRTSRRCRRSPESLLRRGGAGRPSARPRPPSNGSTK